MPLPNLDQEAIQQSIESLCGQLEGDIPSILIVAGSGLGGFASELTDAQKIPYGQIQGFPVGTVVGHAGQLVIGKVSGKRVIVMSGRKHLYEGVTPQHSVHALRALVMAGVKTVILSNAAGCLNPRFHVGDLMLITDHVNNMFQNPLIGENDDRLGDRFPDMSEPYSRELQSLARKAAEDAKVVLREGVYVANLGPSFETKAEVQMLRQYADVVGMSTVPEVIAALHLGAKVAAISLITNTLVGGSTGPTTHEEVLETGREAAARFSSFIKAFIARIEES